MDKKLKSGSFSPEPVSNFKDDFHELFDAAPVCIHRLNLQGQITNMNAAGLRMMGLDHENEIIGVDYISLLASGDQQRIKKLFNKALQGVSSNFEFTLKLNSHPAHFESCFAPISNTEGQLNSIMGVSQNVTQRKETEIAL